MNDIKEKFHLIMETVDRTETKSLRRLLKPGGHLIMVSAGMKDMLLSGLRSALWRIKVHTGVATVTAENMEFFKRLIEKGEYRPVLETTYAMEDVVAAHRHAEGGHKRGNIALRIG